MVLYGSSWCSKTCRRRRFRAESSAMTLGQSSFWQGGGVWNDAAHFKHNSRPALRKKVKLSESLQEFIVGKGLYPTYRNHESAFNTNDGP